MPELPEVEIVKRGLSKHLVGHRVERIEILRDKSFPNDPVLTTTYLVGSKVTRVKRRAKLLLIELSSGYTLATHLKMTGQLVYRADDGKEFGAGHPTSSLVERLPDNSTRVILWLDGGKLFFNDQRVFGWMKLLPTAEVVEMEFIKKLGPEPLDKEFTVDVLKTRMLRRKGSQIKAVLLDQTVLSGMGNIYTDEALWLAKINPLTKVSELSVADFAKLHEAIIFVLDLGIEKGGSTDKNYVDVQGKKGSYLAFAKVFRREGERCERCNDKIQKIRVAGRGTHYCPTCQKFPISA